MGKYFKYFKFVKVHTHICAKCYVKGPRDGAYLGLVLWGHSDPVSDPDWVLTDNSRVDINGDG